MKKIFLLSIVMLGLFAACDPSKDDIGAPGSNVTAEQLIEGFSYTQYADEACTQAQTDGNYFKFTTSPSRQVEVYQVNAEGNETSLGSGVSGTFKLSPSRGGNPNQTIHIRAFNFDGTYVDGTKDVTVFVPTELSPEMKLLCSEDGSKTWKWNIHANNGRVWGNMGSDGNSDGKDFALNGGEWWGVTSEEEFMNQLNHTDDGKAHGDESMDATMVFNEDGTVVCYNAEGKEFRKGKFQVQNYDPTYSKSKHLVGTLHVDPGCILFPYEINSGGNMPTDFEIAYLSSGRLVLTYPDKGKWNFDGSGWTEGTFWQFCSETDGKGCLTDYDEATWTWDTDNGPWGNCGYNSFLTGGYASLTGNTWWVVDKGLQEQITKYKYGTNDVEDATMTFSANGSITKSTGGKGTFTFDATKTNDLGGWNEGKSWGRLTVTGDGMLFPVRINAGSVTNEFDVVYFDDDHLVLTYPNYAKGAEGAEGSWQEGTYWRFKKVKTTTSGAKIR